MKGMGQMHIDTTKTNIAPYHIQMENMAERLRELNSMGLPKYRSYYEADGRLVTEAVPEYLEEQSLIARLKTLHEYERALSGTVCTNNLLISLKLDLLACSLIDTRYDATTAARIAVTVYKNRPISRLRYQIAP